MSATRRERLREAALTEIKTIAWKQIAASGAPALSLRAIAREIGMTAPGLYRYYPNREALVTALSIEAFDDFSYTLEAARDALPTVDHIGRYRAVCRGYFQWAADSPARYTLIFGTPVPGYRLNEAAYTAFRRGFLVLQGVIGEAYQAGRIRSVEMSSKMENSLWQRYAALSQAGMPYPLIVTHLALITWTTVHGITSLYIDGYLQGFLGEQVGIFLNQEIESLVKLLGFE